MEIGNLISIIDTATLAANALRRSYELMHTAVLLTPDGSELQSLCQQVIQISKEACDAVAFERENAEQQLAQIMRGRTI